MNLIWVDYLIIIIIFISMIISLLRGFVKEALSLAGWIIAVFIGFAYMNQMALLIQPKLSSLPPSIINLLAFSILLILSLIVAGLLNNLIAKLVEKTGCSRGRMVPLKWSLQRVRIEQLVCYLVLPEEWFWWEY